MDREGFLNMFLLYHYHSSLEKSVVLNLNKLKFSLHKKALCLAVNLTQFLQGFKCFQYVIISLSKRASFALFLNLFLSKNALCQVWLKMAQRFLRKIFSNVVKVFSLFHCNITPWERAWSFLWTNLNSLNPRMLYNFVFKICPVLLEKKIEMCWQVYRKTDEQTNGLRTTCDQNSSHELSVQVS